MQRSPYDCTLSLDVDARIRRPQLQRLFNVCRKVDIAVAPCLFDTSRERVLFDRPLWNNGVILYKNSTAVVKMLERFESIFRKHIEVATTASAEIDCLQHISDAANRKRLLCSDQIALAQLFSPVINACDLKYAQLPEHWNWRGGNWRRHCAESIVIDHHPDIRNGTFNQLSDLAYNLLSDGSASKSALYYNCAISALDTTLTNLSISQCITQMAEAEELKPLVSRLSGAKFNAQEASLLMIALFHQRTLGDLAKAESILKGLIATLNRP